MDRQALLMSQYKKYNNVHLPVLAFLYFYIGKILGFVGKSTKKASNGIYILLKISLNTQGEVWRF